MKKFFLMILAGNLFAYAANADMPEYQDDEEFQHCLKVLQDWDGCVVEETKRALNGVKQNYRNILGNPKLMSWNGNLQTNTEIMRDMYEGWTAYRNRLCSLSEAAAVYAEPLITEKYSCGLYHTLHHKAYLDKILQLMKYSGAEQNNEFDLFKVYNHDEEYTACREEEHKSKTECLSAEQDRTMAKVKDLYSTLVRDKTVGRWNNGPNLQSGNYRDMYDSWVAYRNRLCSLATWAYKQAKIQPKVELDECILFLTQEHWDILDSVLILANSSLDNGFEEYSDGGLAEGQTMTPLQRRIETETTLEK